MGFKETRAKKALILNRLVDLGCAATNQYHIFQLISHTIFLKIVVRNQGCVLSARTSGQHAIHLHKVALSIKKLKIGKAN